MNYRNRKLLDTARGQPCMFEVRGVCCGDPATVVACHSNSAMHGKGTSLKAHDCFIAFGCVNCHDWYDGRRFRDIEVPRFTRTEIFHRAAERTLLHLWREGLIKVAS